MTDGETSPGLWLCSPLTDTAPTLVLSSDGIPCEERPILLVVRTL